MDIKLSNTSKMPCKSWGIPAKACSTGSKLAKVKGSVCFDCYAMKGAYSWPTVHNAYARRLEQFTASPELWQAAMFKKLSRLKSDAFRWFDSGDLQNDTMLEMIVGLAAQLPQIKFWLPTREVRIVLNFLENYGANSIPPNLVIRLSDMMIDKRTNYTGDQSQLIEQAPQVQFSGVTTDKPAATCPAPKQDGHCLDCRACWQTENEYVIYLKH
jgi:hypothetical protein